MTLCTCLNLAVRQEYVTCNPFAKKRPIPPITSRGPESLISHADYALMLSHATLQLRLAREAVPGGCLFRNKRGNAWTDTAFGKAMAGLRRTMKQAGVEIAGRGEAILA